MLNNYYTIKEVVKFLNKELKGYFIEEIYTQEKNKLLLELTDPVKMEIRTIEFSIEPGYNFILLKENFSKAKKNSVNLFEEIYATTIIEVRLYNDDRIIIFELSEEHSLVFTFFSNKANAFVLNQSRIVNAFKDKNEYSDKEAEDVFIKKNKVNADDEVDLNVLIYLKKHHPGLGNIYSNEVLYRSGLKGNETSNDNYKKIINEESEKLINELMTPVFMQYISGDKSFASLTKLKHITFDHKEFNNINTLLTEHVRYNLRSEKIVSAKHLALTDINNRINNVSKKIKGIEIQLKHIEDSENLKIAGKQILNNLHLIKQGDKQLVIGEDIVSADGVDASVIKLKPELTPAENAQNYFDKYKKQKGSADILLSKIKCLKVEKNKLESELARVTQLNDIKSLVKEEKKTEETQRDETSKFRKFKLNDKYEVWVGKDSISNDTLTTKFTSPNDLWFHVRGASGSHTVLKLDSKKDNVDKEMIHRAASIAAYYSKARNSTSVPVAYCEKKYVKKKKGFKAGTVVMEREKVIFVKPGLPDLSG